MPRKRGPRSEKKEPVGVGLTPFLIYVADKEISKGNSGSRSEIICTLLEAFAEQGGYTKDDPEFRVWLQKEGYIPEGVTVP